jgi:uncharacterized protein YhjY with autotransporter beta-barrel domain
MAYSLGGQKEFSPSWFLGGSFTGGTTWTHDDNGGTGSGQVFAGSIALKHTIGPWLFAGSLAIGTNSKRFNSPDGMPGGSLQSDTNAFFTGMRFRAAYDFAFGNWYVRPRADLDITYTHVPALPFRRRAKAVPWCPWKASTRSARCYPQWSSSAAATTSTSGRYCGHT